MRDHEISAEEISVPSGARASTAGDTATVRGPPRTTDYSAAATWVSFHMVANSVERSAAGQRVKKMAFQ